MAKKLQDRVAAYLIEAKGFLEIPSTSQKYRKFMNPLKKGQFYFLGKSGAVRVGRTVSNSISLTLQVHATLQAWERKNKNEKQN